jgi:hypothetical protein
MTKSLTLAILTLALTAQAGIARAETMTYTLSVTVPAMVQMAEAAPVEDPAPAPDPAPVTDQSSDSGSPLLSKNFSSTMFQEQMIQRGTEWVNMRTIVVI